MYSWYSSLNLVSFIAFHSFFFSLNVVRCCACKKWVFICTMNWRISCRCVELHKKRNNRGFLRFQGCQSLFQLNDSFNDIKRLDVMTMRKNVEMKTCLERYPCNGKSGLSCKTRFVLHRDSFTHSAVSSNQMTWKFFLFEQIFLFYFHYFPWKYFYPQIRNKVSQGSLDGFILKSLAKISYSLEEQEISWTFLFPTFLMILQFKANREKCKNKINFKAICGTRNI